MTTCDLGDWGRREIRSAMLYLQDYLNARPLESPTILAATLKGAIDHIEAALRAEPDAYAIISAMPQHDQFIAEFRGKTVRCRKAEHVSIGRSYLLFVDGLVGVVGDKHLSSPRPAGGDHAQCQPYTRRYIARTSQSLADRSGAYQGRALSLAAVGVLFADYHLRGALR